MLLKDAPTFNLKVVIRETRLKPDTLRAWERRYGMPKPDRTPGKHRLYSQRDIDTLKWLIARREEGLSISRAVDMWRSMEADGRDPLLEAARTVAETKSQMVGVVSGEAIADLRHAWLSACMAYDEQRAEHVVAQAFALYPAETVCLQLLQKGLAEIGQGWYTGEVAIQQEHFASALAIRRIEALLASAALPNRTSRIVVACPPSEEHTFSPLLITLMLRRQGWDALFLGANVPLLRLETTLVTVKPQLVIAPAQQLRTAATLLEMAQVVRQQRMALAYGGLVFNRVPALRQRIPAYFLGEQLERVPQAVDSIMAFPVPAPDVETASPEYHAALKIYSEKRPHIEAVVWESIPPVDREYNHLALAIANLAREIEAALILGDVEFIGSDIVWIEGLLVNHRIPHDVLRYFLDVYRQAVESHMGAIGAPIAAWLARTVG